MGIINLMPENHIAEQMEKRVFRKCLFLFPIILAGILVAVLAARGSANNTMETLKQAIREQNETIALVGKLQQAQAKWSSQLKRAQDNAALLDGVPRSYILAAITNSLPDHTALTRFEYETTPPTGGPANYKADAGAIKVRVLGVAVDNVAIGKFVANLSANNLFTSVDLLSNQEDGSNKSLRNFQVVMDLKPAADMRKPVGLAGAVSMTTQYGGQK
jgi:Tfp pilus assembly protein PilN